MRSSSRRERTIASARTSSSPCSSSSSAPRAAASAAVAALALLGAGCGGSSSPASTVSLTPQERHGREVFIRSCGPCHTLSDAGTHGIVGKNLDATRPSYALVLRTLAVPPANMPSDLLPNAADAKAVAAYVAAVTRSR